MQGSQFDEVEFFRDLGARGVRSLLIGRRALVVLGIPVLTADYDLWIHIDDIDVLNDMSQRFGLYPSKDAEQARATGRYKLENDERVDVLVARSVPTVEGRHVVFDEIWPRRRAVAMSKGVTIHLPSLDDLIATKRFGARPKDAEDIRLIEAYREEEEAQS